MKFLHIDKIYGVYFGISFPVYEQWIQQVALTGKFTGSPNEECYSLRKRTCSWKITILYQGIHLQTLCFSHSSSYFFRDVLFCCLPFFTCFKWPPSKTLSQCFRRLCPQDLRDAIVPCLWPQGATLIGLEAEDDGQKNPRIGHLPKGSSKFLFHSISFSCFT